MKKDEVLALAAYAQQGLWEVHRHEGVGPRDERDVEDWEQLLNGMSACVKINSERELYIDTGTAFELIDEYGGSFADGAELMLKLDQYEPSEQKFEITHYSKREKFEINEH